MRNKTAHYKLKFFGMKDLNAEADTEGLQEKTRKKLAQLKMNNHFCKDI
jgi:hypothetical protein